MDRAPEIEKIAEHVPAIIYVFNQTTQSNEYSNHSLSELLGYSAQDAQEMGDAFLPTLCHPEDLPAIAAHFEAIKSLQDGSVLTLEYRMRHKAGHWVWLLSYDSVFERDATGAVTRHIGVATDISQTKQDSDAATKAVTDELETVFDAASSGILALDDDGTIVRINRSARHMLGGTSAPTPFAWPEKIEFLDPETFQALDPSASPITRALSGHEIRNETHLMRRVQDGDDKRYVRVGSANAHSKESNVRAVLVIDDVSNEERNRQVVERKSRLDALGQLTGGIAHDFNNLLAAMLYAVNLANHTHDPAKRRHYLETAADSVKRGSALTTRLLAFARRQPGLASSKNSAESLAEFKDLVRPMIEAQIELEIGVDEPDLHHYCDQAQLETALMNLVLNARDAMLRAGKGNRITIRARSVRIDGTDARQGKSDKNLRYIEFNVADNGPGMDEETLARCTDPFFTTKDSNSGTGLGLAIVYGFVRQSNGDLLIYSQPDLGTTVKVILPRGAELGGREDVVPEVALIRGNGETLLVVEDEEPLLPMVVEALKGLGYSVISAASGREALDLINAGTAFDLLLTDVVMPGEIGGFELARRARETHPKLPVVYMSGYSGFTSVAMGDVAAPLVLKPSTAEQLGEVIANELANASSAD